MSYKTVKAEPDNATYLDTYAWILFEKGNYAEARLYIDDAMKNDGGKSDVSMEHCGDIYYMTGDVDKGFGILEAGIGDRQQVQNPEAEDSAKEVYR